MSDTSVPVLPGLDLPRTIHVDAAYALAQAPAPGAHAPAGGVAAAPMASIRPHGAYGYLMLSIDTPAWDADASGAFRIEIMYDSARMRFLGAAFTGRSSPDLVANASETGGAGMLVLTRSAMPALEQGGQLVVTMEALADAGSYSWSVPTFMVGGVAQALPDAEVALYRGTAGDDLVGSDVVHDQIEGNAGIDTAVFTGERANYVVRPFEAGFAVDHPNGHETRLNWVEHLAFSDRSVALDIDGPAGQAYRLYQAALGRAPDLAGLGYWIAQMEDGATLREVAGAFIQEQEFIRLNGSGGDPDAFATRLYLNVLHRAPDAAGLAYWVAALEGGLDRADVLVQFSESAENLAQVTGQIGNGIDYIPW